MQYNCPQWKRFSVQRASNSTYYCSTGQLQWQFAYYKNQAGVYHTAGYRGTYRLSLVTGSDGNTLLDECGLPVIAGAGFSFNVVSPLSAAFTTGRFLSCRQDSVRFFMTEIIILSVGHGTLGTGRQVLYKILFTFLTHLVPKLSAWL